MYEKRTPMKKIILCSIALYLQYTSVSFGREVRIVPVNKDAMTGHWNGLFGHDCTFGWGEFRQRITEEADIHLAIMQSLQKQTHGVYSLSIEQIKNAQSYVQLANGDVLYCIPVDYISAPMLHKKMEASAQRDLTKDKFVWLPIDELLRRRTLIKCARGKTSLFVFDWGIKNLMKTYWHTSLLPQLHCVYSQKPFQFSQKDHIKKYLENKQKPKQLKKVNLHGAKRIYAAEKKQLKVEKKPKILTLQGNLPTKSRRKL
jgi:hypothetical protein